MMDNATRVDRIRVVTRDWRAREVIAGYLLVLPIVVLFFGLIAYPFFNAIWLSVTDRIIGSGVSLWAQGVSRRSSPTTRSSIPDRLMLVNADSGCAAPVKAELRLSVCKQLRVLPFACAQRPCRWCGNDG